MKKQRPLLKIENLTVSIQDHRVVHDLTLTLQEGELSVLMGPNGSGKSSLAHALIGDPRYQVKKGGLNFLNKEQKWVDLGKLKMSERGQQGILLTYQWPVAVDGVTLLDLLWSAYQNQAQLSFKKTPREGPRAMSLVQFKKRVSEQAEKLGLSSSLLNRSINVGFSGGESKKSELLQVCMLRPRLAIFDEIDSGLDVDAMRQIVKGIQVIKEPAADTTILLITHYPHILKHLKPDRVIVMKTGQIVRSGSHDLIRKIEKSGYAKI